LDPLISIMPLNSNLQTVTDTDVQGGDTSGTAEGGASSFGDALIENIISLLGGTGNATGLRDMEHLSDAGDGAAQSAADFLSGCGVLDFPSAADLAGNGMGEIAGKIMKLLQQSAGGSYGGFDRTQGQGKKLSSDEMLEIQKLLAAFSVKGGTDRDLPAGSEDIAENAEDGQGGDSADSANDNGDVQENGNAADPVLVACGEVYVRKIADNSPGLAGEPAVSSERGKSGSIGNILDESNTAVERSVPNILASVQPKDGNAENTNGDKVEGRDIGGGDVKHADATKILPEKTVPRSARGHSSGDKGNETSGDGLNGNSTDLLFADDKDSDSGLYEKKLKTVSSDLSSAAVGTDAGTKAGTGIQHLTDQRSIVLESANGEGTLCEGVAHVISFLKDDKGDKKGVVRLEPPELGSMKVEISQSGDKVHVHLTVERSEAGEMLKGSEDTLKGSLKKQGISLGSLSVNVGSEQGGNYSGNSEYKSHGNYGTPDFSGDPEQTDDETTLAVIDLGQGLLHWIA